MIVTGTVMWSARAGSLGLEVVAIVQSKTSNLWQARATLNGAAFLDYPTSGSVDEVARELRQAAESDLKIAARLAARLVEVMP